MTKDEEEKFALFLAKYRWVLLRALRALRDAGGDALDEPRRLLAATTKLNVLVKMKLAELGKRDEDVDAADVRAIADGAVASLGTRLLE